MRIHSALLALGLLLTAVPLTLACLWDYDTLAQERARFPETLELITGRFPRHSRAFYQWRVKDRLARLEKEPQNAALYDDLAVAYDKLGDHAAAITTMETKESIQPGMYETQANLATFYFHSGQLEAAVKHVEQALAIDPNAHFGREKYQLLLGKFVLHGRAEQRQSYAHLSPQDMQQLKPHLTIEGFAEFLKAEGETDRKAAIQGVLGMMRFANYDSPILLEALASLLAAGHQPSQDARLLAARALLQASYKTQDDDAASEAFRQAASKALSTHDGYTLERLEREFQKELAEAATWIAVVESDEQRWIAANADVDAEFHRKYYRPYQQAIARGPYPAKAYLVIGVGLAAATIVGVALTVAWLRRGVVGKKGKPKPPRAEF